jgi:hypothetical protein
MVLSRSLGKRDAGIGDSFNATSGEDPPISFLDFLFF